jgi:heme-degrading monooxygenase HmoA
MIIKTPAPPYYVVIFSIVRAKVDEDQYQQMAERMVTLAAQQDGFLGFEYGPETPEGFSLSVSYWRDDAAIRKWKQNAEHLITQKLGKEKWYPAYSIKIARVERAYAQGV